MGLIVPLLRLLYVSLNVYETFKTLKLPPPSSRNGGQPSVRAMSQRKRAMKGCLSIWVVWCCYAAYERSVDGIIGVFIPFYNEIKSLVILFFLITRSRGAEPIYLHVLRPLVKPYTETLDATLNVVQHCGDIVILLFAVPLSVPLSVISSLYRRWILREKPSDDTEVPQAPADEPETGASEFGKTRSRKKILHNAHLRATATQPTPASPEVWATPSSTIADSPPSRRVGLPTPPSEDQMLYPRPQPSDEWRQYEAFPSAYPATPPPRKSGLPSAHYQSFQSSVDGLPNHRADRAGFRRSLLSARESQNPDSDDGMSDDLHTNVGVHTDEELSLDGEYEEDEDDFNVTLQTPYPLSRLMNVSMTAPYEEEDSNDSTGLSTVDYGSPLQTRTNSEASHYDLSDDSPTIGRKRPLPASIRTAQATRPAMRERSSTQDTIRAKPTTTRPSVRAPLASRTQSKGSDSSVNEAQDAEEAAKKRRVGPTTGAPKVVSRQPLTKQGENKAPARVSKALAGANTIAPRAPLRPATKLAPKTSTGRPIVKQALAKETAAVPADMDTV